MSHLLRLLQCRVLVSDNVSQKCLQCISKCYGKCKTDPRYTRILINTES